MPVRLLFITSHFFLQPTLDALSRMDLSCETMVFPYNNFEHLCEVYREHIDRFDACFVSGTSAKSAIELGCPDIEKPLIAFQVSSDGLHRNILRLAVEKQSLDFSRIAIDFLIPLGTGFRVSDYLAIEDPSIVIPGSASWMQSSSCGIEQFILDQICRLWDQGAIDLVICQYSSIVPTLEKLGIPYCCPFLSDEHLKQVIEETLLRIELSRLHGNHPAIIQVCPRQPHGPEDDQLRKIYDSVQKYIQQNMINCVIQYSTTCCTLITTMQILRFMTDRFRTCRISSWLEAHLSFPISVAYGIGTTVSHAMNNVQTASKEAQLLGLPFIVDTNGNLIGPLNSENRMVIPPNSLPDVSEIARRCSLSAMTIQKLLNLVQTSGSDKITTQELARRLDTTVRNANRIMRNLCQGNVAKPVYTQTSHSRGRPIQVYALDFGLSLA